jgi:DNA replication protein DnaC
MTMQLSLAEDSVRMTDGSRQLQGERVEAIRFTSLASEPICSLCSGTGWRRAGNDDFMRYRRCECVKARCMAARLAAIPALFREANIHCYQARNPQQERVIALMKEFPDGSFYMSGPYGSGKTHLFYAQYREITISGKTLCHVRTTRELLEELKKMELNSDFVSPVMAAAYSPAPYHLFWDDIDKLKPTDFKTEVLFDLVDSLYRRKHGLTVTSNYSLQDLVERERMHPAIVRRLDDMCRAIQI